MKSVQDWLDAYGESHQNPLNKQIHWVCVPLIMWSLLGLIASIEAPTSLKRLAGFELDYAALFLLLVTLYYLRMSMSLALGMGLVSALMWLATHWLADVSASLSLSLWHSSLIIFVLAWAGQFIGHKIEGKKPSFFEDLQFLMIGPMWLLATLYRWLGVSY